MELPSHRYGKVMTRISDRFRLIDQIKSLGRGNFSANEGIAFQLRKIIEGVAYGCVISSETGSKDKVRSARGHWNAKNVLNELDKKRRLSLPNPSLLRAASDEESSKDDVKWTIEGQPNKCLTKAQIIEIYEQTHAWLHELNPFYNTPKFFLEKHEDALWNSSVSMEEMLSKHFIALMGEGFYCTLFDQQTGTVKVLPLSRQSENYAQTH